MRGGYRLIRAVRSVITQMARIGGKNICCICNAKLPMWLPHPAILYIPILMKPLNVIGSDLKNFECPVCHSFDRERHLVLFFEKTGFLAQYVNNKAVLTFAPEEHITKLIVANAPKKYIKCDLYPNSADVERIDMHEIPYDAKTFDVVIANHVLEHVFNENIALSELYRILKVGGVALLQTPFSAKLNTTFSDTGIDTDFLRTQLFGQTDHVRLYGKDIFDKFSSHGLIPRIGYHKDILEDFNAEIYGVNENEPFMLFQRVG